MDSPLRMRTPNGTSLPEASHAVHSPFHITIDPFALVASITYVFRSESPDTYDSDDSESDDGDWDDDLDNTDSESNVIEDSHSVDAADSSSGFSVDGDDQDASDSSTKGRVSGASNETSTAISPTADTGNTDTARDPGVEGAIGESSDSEESDHADSETVVKPSKL
jgi:hypothetical protein